MEPTCYGPAVDPSDRDDLLALQQVVVDTDLAAAAALVARNERMRALKVQYGHGSVAEMARVLGVNRTTVSDVVNEGVGSGRRTPNRGTAQ